MKYFIISLVMMTFILFSCKKDKDNEPKDSAYFSYQWKVETAPNLPLGIEVDNTGRNYFYVAQKAGGVYIYERQTEPEQEIGSVPISSFGNNEAMNLVQVGNYLYVALGNLFEEGTHAGLAIIDITDPTQPNVTDFWVSPSIGKGSSSILVEGNYAYLGAMNQGVFVFDISNVNSIVELEHFIPNPDFPIVNPSSVQEPNVRGLALKGNDLYVAYDAGGIRVLDVTDKSNLSQKSQYIIDLFDKQKAYNNIIINGDYAYTSTDYCGMEVLNISNSDSLTLASWCNPWNCETTSNNWFNSDGHANDLVYISNKNQVVLSSGASEIIIIDVSDPMNSNLIATYGSIENDEAAWGLDLEGNDVYATYITNFGIPFKGIWSGIKKVQLK